MFLLDTNVVSELLRPSPETIVAHWVGNRHTTELYFSAVGEAELLYGVAILPAGHRKSALAFAIDAVLHEDLQIAFSRSTVRLRESMHALPQREYPQANQCLYLTVKSRRLPVPGI